MSNLKIIFALILSFILTMFLSNIFIANTPRINKNFFVSLFSKKAPTPTPYLLTSTMSSFVPLSTIPKRFTPTPTQPSPTPPSTSAKASADKSPTAGKTPTPTTAPTPTPAPTRPTTSQLSSSKLGIFILSSYSDGARNIVASGPRVIKVMDAQSNPGLMEAVKEYKSKFPNGKVVLRIYINAPGNDVNTNPVTVAEKLFNQYIRPGLNQLGDNIRYFDYLETPNESEQTPIWETTEDVNWHSQFWMRLADLNNQAGIKTCAGSISVGNVGGTSFDEIGTRIAVFVPTLRYLKKIGGAWCYHGYTIHYTTDVNDELWYSLRHRIFYDYLSKNAPDVADIPMVISEGGVDQSGNAETSGWQARGSPQQYEDWLQWYDKQIKQDSYVIGVTLFQSGDDHWSSFNIDPIANWLADHLRK